MNDDDYEDIWLD